MSDSLGLGGGSGDSGAVDDIDNVDDGDFNADLNTDDDVGNGVSHTSWLLTKLTGTQSAIEAMGTV